MASNLDSQEFLTASRAYNPITPEELTSYAQFAGEHQFFPSGWNLISLPAPAISVNAEPSTDQANVGSQASQGGSVTLGQGGGYGSTSMDNGPYGGPTSSDPGNPTGTTSEPGQSSFGAQFGGPGLSFGAPGWGSIDTPVGNITGSDIAGNLIGKGATLAGLPGGLIGPAVSVGIDYATTPTYGLNTNPISAFMAATPIGMLDSLLGLGMFSSLSAQVSQGLADLANNPGLAQDITDMMMSNPDIFGENPGSNVDWGNIAPEPVTEGPISDWGYGDPSANSGVGSNPGPGTGGPAADSPAGGAQAASGNAPGTGVGDGGSGSDGSSGGGCFITTAVCQYKGLPDDCDELQTLRWWRDNIVLKETWGRNAVDEYYRTAPGIVKAISENGSEIYSVLYKKYIQPTVRKVKDGQYDDALLLYIDMISWLKDVSICFSTGTGKLH